MGYKWSRDPKGAMRQYGSAILATACLFVDIRALWRSALSVRVPGCQKLQMMA